MNDPINFGYCFLRFDILNDFELNDFEKFDVTQFGIQYVFAALYLPFLVIRTP